MAPSARQRSAAPSDSVNDDPHSQRPKRKTKRRKQQPFLLVPSHVVTEWTRINILVFVAGVVFLAVVNFTPLIMLEEASDSVTEQSNSLESLLEISQDVQRHWAHRLGDRFVRRKAQAPVSPPKALLSPPIPMAGNFTWNPPRRGHIKCEVNVDHLVYWNDPQSTADQNFRSPFAQNDGIERFLTFEPDLGGWNNIRMSLEILVVFAATTGRTLVLPPKSPMNLLGHGQTYARSFADFFPLDHPELQRHVKIITMKEFIEQHGHRLLLSSVFTPEQLIEKVRPAIETCNHDSQTDSDCNRLYIHLRQHGYQPKIHAVKNCFIFDETYFKFATTKSMTAPGTNIRKFCENRTALAYAPALTKIEWIHWQASDERYQLLNHFYTFFFFTDSAIGKFYERLIRDFLRYSDDIYCVAGKIVHALQQQRPQEGSSGIEPSFSTLHVRRADFRYHQVTMTAEEWLKSTKQIFRPGEVLYIATDEHNKTFFAPLVEYGYEIRFLDDFHLGFGLDKLDRTCMGMVDSVVASHGRAFVGTWLSTFSGYIIRMRGYLGHDMKNTWYSFLPKQRTMHVPVYPQFELLQYREWPLGWDDIDENATIDIRLPQLKNMRAAAETEHIHENAIDRPEQQLPRENHQTDSRHPENNEIQPPPKEEKVNIKELQQRKVHEPMRLPQEQVHSEIKEPKFEAPKQSQATKAQPQEASPRQAQAMEETKKDSLKAFTAKVETIAAIHNQEQPSTMGQKGASRDQVRIKLPPSDTKEGQKMSMTETKGEPSSKVQIDLAKLEITSNEQVHVIAEKPKQATLKQVRSKKMISEGTSTFKQQPKQLEMPATFTAPKTTTTAPIKRLDSISTPKGAGTKQALTSPTETTANQVPAPTSVIKRTATPKQVLIPPARPKTATTTPQKLQTPLAESNGATFNKAVAAPVTPKGATTKQAQVSTENAKTSQAVSKGESKGAAQQQLPVSKKKETLPKEGATIESSSNATKDDSKVVPPQRKKPSFTVSDLISSNLSDAILVRDLPVARGLAGRPLVQTPSLIGARRGHIECEVNVDSLAYWNNPQGERDKNFKSPYAVKGAQTKYLTFIPDAGGWNNIRMGMETIFVFAAASGRTLVLPPEEPLYLLTGDKKDRYRGFGDFFPLHTAELQKRVPVISTEEFIKREGGPGGRLPLPEANKTKIMNAVKHCEYRAKSEDSCFPLWDYLERVGRVPQIGSNYAPGKPSAYHCVIFDEDVYGGGKLKPEYKDLVTKFCGQRNLTFWTQDFEDPVLLHFKTKDGATRLLVHFYAFMLFTNPFHDHYFKRFVRDFLHYQDRIYCAAGKIVKALQIEAHEKGFPRDSGGNGGFSSLHIRRGDFQYKEVKLSAEDWYNNTKELWQPKEILYIATDERNKTFFDPLAEHHELRFLDDYWQMANLSNLDPNFMGMIDTIVASRGRVFVGTWFSTFSGYINRMRGYHGLSMNDSWYSWLPRKAAVHKWEDEDGKKYSFEWPTGWIGIDADTRPSKAVF